MRRPGEAYLSGLGDFWSVFFRDAELVEALGRGVEQLLGQAYLDILTGVLHSSLPDSPIFDRELWRLITIRKDQARYNATDTTWDVELDAAQVNLATAGTLQSGVLRPLTVLEHGLDYELVRRTAPLTPILKFQVDPFAEATRTAWPGVASRMVDVTDPAVFHTGLDGHILAEMFAVSVYHWFQVRGVVRRGADGNTPGGLFFYSNTANFSLEDVGRTLAFGVPGSAIVTEATILSVKSEYLVEVDVVDETGDPLYWEVRDTTVFTSDDIGNTLTVTTDTEVLARTVVEIVNGYQVRVDPPFDAPVTAGPWSWELSSPTTVEALAFWAPNVGIDNQQLWLRYGSLVEEREPSSEAYQAWLEGIFRYFTGGPQHRLIESALNTMTGVPVARVEGEVITALSETATEDRILTDSTLYRLPLGARKAELQVGDVLTALQPLSNIFEVRDHVSDPTWYYGEVVPAELLPDDSPQLYRRAADPTLYPFRFGVNRWKFGDLGLKFGADSDGVVIPTRSGKDGGAISGLGNDWFQSLDQDFTTSDVGQSIIIDGESYEILDIEGADLTPYPLRIQLDTDLTSVYAPYTAVTAAAEALEVPPAPSAFPSRIVNLTSPDLLTPEHEGARVLITGGTHDGEIAVVEYVLSPTSLTMVNTAGVPYTFSSAADITSVSFYLLWEIEPRTPLQHSTGYTVMHNVLKRHTFSVRRNTTAPNPPFFRTAEALQTIVLRGKSAYTTLFFDGIETPLADQVNVSDDIVLTEANHVRVFLADGQTEHEGPDMVSAIDLLMVAELADGQTEHEGADMVLVTGSGVPATLADGQTEHEGPAMAGSIAFTPALADGQTEHQDAGMLGAVGLIITMDDGQSGTLGPDMDFSITIVITLADGQTEHHGIAMTDGQTEHQGPDMVPNIGP